MAGVAPCAVVSRRPPGGSTSRIFGGGLLRRPRTRHRDVARRAFLQQQLRRLDHRLGVEPRPHRAVEKRVGDGDDRHALMVGHEGAHDRDAFAFGQAARRVVQRLVEAIAAARADRGEPLEVSRRRLRIDHARERGRIRRDDDVFAEPALQPEAGHAEVRILVGELQVAGVVGGFRNAPGDPERGPVFDLPPHDQPARPLDQAAGRRAHHERRHQIFEHRARPGDQRGAVRDRRDGAAEPEPVAGRNVALGDRHEARQPRLGGEQIVAARVERPSATR